MTTINTNIKALYVQNALQVNERSLTAAMQQLSTGKRINSAKDDAAGLAIATRMTQQIDSLNQAVRNANDAISLVQTAEGATQEITIMLQRMRELAIQAMNDTNANDQRSYLDLEFQQLKQQIVQIANNTEWNGFPILNGSAGYRVGPVPVFKAVADGQLSSDITFSAGSITSSPAGTITTGGSGTLSKSGSLHLTVNAGAATASATLQLDDGNTLSLSGTVSGKTITFTDSALTDGSGTGTFTLTTSGADWGATDTLSLKIARAMPTLSTMGAGDVIINGQTVPAATADSVSTADNAAASALARAAAINSVTADSGVHAVVGKSVMSGGAMTASASVTGTVTLNGYVSPTITTVANNTQASRAAVIAAINAMAQQTGVVAVDTGSDARGIRLEAADGRNIEIAFNTGSTAAGFAAATGLRQGVQTGSLSLESPVDTAVNITTNGDINTSGLSIGNFKANQTAVSTLPRMIADSAGDVAALQVGDLVINGIAVPASMASSDNVSDQTAASSSRASSAIAIAAAINSVSSQTGVTAKANEVAIESAAVDSYNFGTQVLYINGHAVSVDLSTDPTTRVHNIVDAVNHQLGDGGVVASASSGGNGIVLTSKDGRNLSVWFDSAQTDGANPSHTLSAASFGLDAAAVTGIPGATSTSTGAQTVYATVSLQSTVADAPQPAYANVIDKPVNPDGLIDVKAGQNGFDLNSNFLALGFAEGTYGGKSGVEMSPPRVGRLTFQVGASAGQVVTIDLADFGDKGPITGSITKDYQSATPTVQIGTAEGANAVLSLLDAAMNQVNATRARMGAVMNRLSHVVDNLTNVSTNSAQSRSQIEDADYASASTNLARAQIIQQAATAVLAQANASQQTVLKLLQG